MNNMITASERDSWPDTLPEIAQNRILVRKWFKAQKRVTKLGVKSNEENASGLTKGTLISAVVTLATLPFFPVTPLIMGAGTCFFGVGAISLRRKKRSFEMQQQLVKKNYRDWKKHQDSVDELMLFKKTLGFQRRNLNDASEGEVAEVAAKIKKQWTQLGQKVSRLQHFRNKKLKKLDSAIRKKHPQDQKKDMLEILDPDVLTCKIDEYMKQCNRDAYGAFYRAVQARESDTRDLHTMQISIPNIPSLVTDNQGSILKLG